MRIATLEIHGFRGIKHCRLCFGQQVVLVGPNNVGKTTIIEALALLLGRDRMVRHLTEHDFHNSCPQPADRIKIVAAIAGFDEANVDPNWIAARRGIGKWLNPETGTISATKDATHTELVCEIALMARFDLDSLEVEHVRYFLDDDAQDPFDDESVTLLPQHLIQELGFFLISARRSWDRMFSFGSELFRRVVATAGGLPAASIVQERDRLREPNFALESDVNLKPVIEEVEQEMESLFGTQGRVHLRITSTDSDGVMDAIVPHYASTDGAAVPASRQGSGLISLQSLFLLLHFGKRRVGEGKGFIIALEEPELHLPPSIQRRVLHRLQALSSQTIITTHSPLIAAFAQPTELYIVRNSGGNLAGKPMLKKPVGHTTPNALRGVFQLRRTEAAAALMNDVVLVPEGIIDVEWLQLLQRVTELKQMEVGREFGARVGLLAHNSQSQAILVKTLSEAHPCVTALVDGDDAGRGYATALESLHSGAHFILRWPDEWTIEDVVGWIVEADNLQVLAKLSQNLPLAPQSVGELVARLKNNVSSDPAHLKGDRTAYEEIATAIAESDPCSRRVGELLAGIAAAASGTITTRFATIAGSRVGVFQP